MIDLHTHILPGVDDGARNLGQSVEICRQAAAEGTTVMVATPHVRQASYWNNDNKALEHAWRTLRFALARDGVAVDVLLGGEIAIHSDSLDELILQRRRGRTPTLFTLAGSRAVLLEFDFQGIGPDPVETVHEVMVAGYQPVVAHPERFRWMAHDHGLLAALFHHGAHFQLTAMSLTGDLGRFAQEAAIRMMDNGWIRFIASDTHDPRLRPPGLAKAHAQVERTWGAEAARAIFFDHPRALLDDAFPP